MESRLYGLTGRILASAPDGFEDDAPVFGTEFRFTDHAALIADLRMITDERLRFGNRAKGHQLHLRMPKDVFKPCVHERSTPQPVDQEGIAKAAGILHDCKHALLLQWDGFFDQGPLVDWWYNASNIERLSMFSNNFP